MNCILICAKFCCRNESLVTFIVTTPSPIVYKTIHTKAERHTGEYVAKIMAEVMLEIGVHKFIGVVTDNAAPMVKAWGLLAEQFSDYHITYYGCIAHTLNLLIGDVMKQASFVKIESTCKEIIKCVKYSQRLTALFKSIQESKKGKCGVRALQLPVKTRWGSIITCLASLESTKYALQSLCIAEEVDDKIMAKRLKSIILDGAFWTKVTTTINLLKPIGDLITSLESDKPCLSRVAEAFKMIHDNLQWNLVSSQATVAEGKRIEDAVEHRKQQALKPLHLASNILDPNFQGSSLTPEEDVDGTEFIYDLAKSLPNINQSVVMLELAQYKTREGLWAKPFVWENIKEGAASMDPLLWWKAICNSSTLSKIATVILGLPATSAATERSFSTFGAIHTKKRNKLTTKRASMLMHISHNLKIERGTCTRQEQKLAFEKGSDTEDDEDEEDADEEDADEDADEEDADKEDVEDEGVVENVGEERDGIDVNEDVENHEIPLIFDFPEFKTY